MKAINSSFHLLKWTLALWGGVGHFVKPNL
jgi:hypothetical protein